MSTLVLKINGSAVAEAEGDDLTPLDVALRGVALADSPVTIRAAPEIGMSLLERLHTLGRRAELPIRHCHSPEDAESLLSAVRNDGQTEESVRGTWALFGVDAWPRELQMNLARVLRALDEGRLEGRLAHAMIPRTIVMQELDEEVIPLDPELARRLGYFEIEASAK